MRSGSHWRVTNVPPVVIVETPSGFEDANLDKLAVTAEESMDMGQIGMTCEAL